MTTSAQIIRHREGILSDTELRAGVEYRAMLQMRWYRVVYIASAGYAGNKQMHKWRWITGPRAGQTQQGWVAFRPAKVQR